MPWSAKDAKKHKKGLNEEQAKKWAKVANEVLRECKSKGGSQSECEAKAIRIANSKFSYEGGSQMKFTRETRKLPKRALLVEDEAGIDLSRKEEDGTIKMDAYSGKIIKGHFIWGDLALDVQGCEVDSKRMPILEQHDIFRKIGFSNSPPDVSENKIAFSNIKPLSNDHAQEFLSNANEGFPYQASVRVYPSKIEELAEGEKADVNGFTMKGPGTIFRKYKLKEASVCVFGYDSRTSVGIFADDTADEELELEVGRGETQLDDDSGAPVDDKSENPEKELDDKEGKGNKQSSNGGTFMNLKELKEQQPELYASLTEEVKAELSQDDKKDETIQNLQTQLTESNKSIKALEKENALRREKELKAHADAVIDSALSQSQLPTRLQGKVKSMFNHNNYLDENEALKVDDLKAAVETEVKDWVTGLSESQSSVRGMGGGGDDSSFSDEGDADADAERILSYVTQSKSE